MRDEYTELIEEQDRISQEFREQRKWYEELQARSAAVTRQLYVLRERVISAQGERCAYCGTLLRSNRSYQLDRELRDLELDYLISDEEWEARRRAQDPVPYESRAKFHIRLKVPKSRGGLEVMENLVACCAECGRRKHTKTHDEFLRLMEEERAGAAAELITVESDRPN